MEKFFEYRKDYPVFEYNSYEINDNGDSYEVVYKFNIPGLTEFTPRWEFPKTTKQLTKSEYELFEKAIFNLGMVEVISYLKCVCSPKLVVKAGKLTEKQIEWYKKLYINGLGEFFYVNNIVNQMNVDTFLEIEAQNQKEETNTLEYKMELSGNLIPVGGGKDSAVTLEVLSDTKKDNTCYVINVKGASSECINVAGYNKDSSYFPKRFLDKRLIELNSQGYLNGHTPFSAIVAFSSYAAAILLRKKYIILSNEDSANEGNVLGTNINHQYSKSIEFENDFRAYCTKYMCKNGPEYFSLLRPISEWQIVKAFCKNPIYYPVFKSCNVGSKGDVWKWCENCPKCLYVYIMMRAFLDDKDMKKIFSTDMLDNKKLVHIFNGLVYPDYDKPFECVGTKEEINLCLDMIVDSYAKAGKKMPILLDKYKSSKEDLEFRKKAKAESWNELNNLPEVYAKKLKDYIA